ncbi:hypothetical protein FOA32_001679 [Streptococcus sinensis]|nr:hypothetical protein [Streptococcus sinensis]
MAKSSTRYRKGLADLVSHWMIDVRETHEKILKTDFMRFYYSFKPFLSFESGMKNAVKD